MELGSDDESWYCKAECGLCSGAVLDEHKEVQMTALLSLKLCEIRLVVPGFVPNVIFFNFPDSFFSEQLKLEGQNRFISLAKYGETKTPSTGTNNKFISRLKFSSKNVNGIS